MLKKMWMTAVCCVLLCASAFAAEWNGKWTTEIDTPMGKQKYTYDIHVEGTKLTGKAITDRGEIELQDGKIDGDNISFVENVDMGGNQLSIVYNGKIEGDEIKFTRKVGDFATEKFVAKRMK